MTADSSATADPYSIEAEVDGLAAVLAVIRADTVFGHSYGGYIAWTAARRLHLSQVAVYDPAASFSGGFPTDFIEPFAEAVTDGEHVRAFGLLNRGLRPRRCHIGAASDDPDPVGWIVPAHHGGATMGRGPPDGGGRDQGGARRERDRRGVRVDQCRDRVVRRCSKPRVFRLGL